jgi:hypothetical protein
MKQKVFCIGWHKTGTTTMGWALHELGFKVVGARLDLSESLLQSDSSFALELSKEFEAFQDVPWAMLYKELDKTYPGSKFVLTIREEQSWLKSASKHFSSNYSAMREWIYGNGVLKGNEELYLERYRAHYKNVYLYFQGREKDILVFDFNAGNGWEELCGFLGLAVPNKKFPHANKALYKQNRFKRIYKKIKKLLPTGNWLKFRSNVGFKPEDVFNNREQNKKIRKDEKS